MNNHIFVPANDTGPDPKRNIPQPLTIGRVEIEVAIQRGFVRGDAVQHVFEALREGAPQDAVVLYSDSAIEAAVRAFLFAIRMAY